MKMRFSMPTHRHIYLVATLASLVAVFAYLGSYFFVRHTHTMCSSSLDGENLRCFTVFNSRSRVDDELYVGFYPMLVLDEKLGKRDFTKQRL